MVAKKRAVIREPLYFDTPGTIEFIHSGSTLLDCVLGGGFPLGRIANVVGDKAVGKTLLAIETATNFLRLYSGPVFYNETESAFDKGYAAALGLQTDKVTFIDGCETVEDFYEDLNTRITSCIENKTPGLYILDSLDALTDAAELDRGIGDKTYGGTKAKQLSQLFRRVIRRLSDANMCLLIISQVRDDIGSMFGRGVKRSGGKGLDFYASQVIYLAHLKRLTRTIGGVKRAYGVRVKASCDKNKIGLPFRDCEFCILFSYGIDDLESCINWLQETKHLSEMDLTIEKAKDLVADRFDEEKVSYHKVLAEAQPVVKKVWQQIDKGFEIPISKYQLS